MKALGVILIVVGALAFLYGISMETTIGVGLDGDRVSNFGLMIQSQNAMLGGLAVVILGTILATANPSGGGRAAPYKNCFYCAERIQPDATVCPHCKNDLPR